MTTAGIDITRDAVAERRHRVAELTRAGMSASEIAVHLGITKRSVQRAREKTGSSGPMSGLPLTAEELARAAAMLDDGASVKEVARTLRRSTTAIKRHFPGRAWTLRQSGEFGALIRDTNRLLRSTA